MDHIKHLSPPAGIRIVRELPHGIRHIVIVPQRSQISAPHHVRHSPVPRNMGAMIVENAKTLVGQDVFIASTAYVGGAVTLGDESTVMHHVVIRGDVSHIRIGQRVNVQDGSVIHTTSGVDLDIEDDVSIGHRAIVHCRRIGARSLIGMGSIVLDGCTIGSRCIIGAGAVVPPNTDVPDGKVVMGVPGRIVRDIRESDHAYLDYVVENYRKLGRRHEAGAYPNVAPKDLEHSASCQNH